MDNSEGIVRLLLPMSVIYASDLPWRYLGMQVNDFVTVAAASHGLNKTNLVQ